MNRIGAVPTKSTRRQTMLAAVAAFFIVGLFFQAQSAFASMKQPPPKKVDVIIIGDRVVDIAYNLGVMPTAMSVRGSLWPMAAKLKTVSQILGCPRCIVRKAKTIPNACKKFGINRIIVEKSDPYCLYMPKVKPENIIPLMKDCDVTIEYVDFSTGLDNAVRQTAELLNCKDKADAVIQKYHKQMQKVQADLPKKKSGNKVVIFNGTYQASSGKLILRVEAPGGYADQFLLEKIGWVNAGNAFLPASGKVSKGHYPVRKKKGGMMLDPLIAADPDAIVLTGDAFAAQKALAVYGASNPSLAKVKAIRNMAVYSLPAYVDSGVLEYPGILKKWAAALSD